jgi:hypothetical protein
MTYTAANVQRVPHPQSWAVLVSKTLSSETVQDSLTDPHGLVATCVLQQCEHTDMDLFLGIVFGDLACGRSTVSCIIESVTRLRTTAS